MSASVQAALQASAQVYADRLPSGRLVVRRRFDVLVFPFFLPSLSLSLSLSLSFLPFLLAHAIHAGLEKCFFTFKGG